MIRTLLSLAVLLPVAAFAAQTNVAEDEASRSQYNEGWSPEKNGGSGFKVWSVATRNEEGSSESHAGYFIAQAGGNNPEAAPVATDGKAFGMFANGTSFEAVVAYREFAQPMAKGDTFSLKLRHGLVEPKFESDDPRKAAIGVALRTGNPSSGVDDYNRDARVEIVYEEGESHYKVIDGGSDTDTGVSVSDAGLDVSVTLTGPDTYDLELTNLSTREIKKLPGRKLGGTAGGALNSVSIFNRDGEKNDVFFNSLQVTRDAP